ncbi:crossover junction endodeoxyribonuclease RuvC [Chlamydiota bacterium]
MRVMGIDPGTLCTGYGVVDLINNKVSHVASGAISNRNKTLLSDRFSKIYNEIVSAIHQYCPECVSIENIFYCKNVSVAIKLGMVRGIAILAARECSLPIVEYSAKRVKQAVVGYGNAHKVQVMVMIKRLLQLEEDLKKEDIADALALAICHLHTIKSGLQEPDYL